MNTRNLVRFLSHTCLIGGISTVILGLIIRPDAFEPWNITTILATIVWFIVLGFLFAVISQVGFFAYLFVHQIGLQIFRSIWNAVQLVVVIFVLFDLVYFRFQAFANENDSLVPYVGSAVLITVVALIVAYFKVRTTNKSTFISALFFMVVVTIIEWLPGLRTNDPNWLYLMLFAIIICNAFQILSLPKYNRQSEEERALKKQTQSSTPTKTKAKSKKAIRS